MAAQAAKRINKVGFLVAMQEEAINDAILREREEITKSELSLLLRGAVRVEVGARAIARRIARRVASRRVARHCAAATLRLSNTTCPAPWTPWSPVHRPNP